MSIKTRTSEVKETSAILFVQQGWFLAVVALALIASCVWMNFSFFHDDTYITLRYARHLLAGIGPVWNSQGPRVEGFTSPLHLLLVSAVSALKIPLPMAARIVNMTSHLILLLFVYEYLKQRTEILGARLGALMIAASWMFLVWDLGGLDAVLFASLGTIGVLTGARWFESAETKKAQALGRGSLVLAFALLARPEGFLLLGGLWLLAAVVPVAPIGERTRALMGAIGAAFLVLLPVIVFRWFYFHEWAPNTMYAKMGGIQEGELLRRGIHYFGSFLVRPPFLGWFALAAGAYCLRRRCFRTSDGVIWLLIGMAALFPVVSGGDHMVAYRFCLILIPLLATLLVLHLSRAGVLANPRLASGVVVVLVLSLILQMRSGPLNPRVTDAAALEGRIIGEYIAGHWRSGSVVALNTAGSTPFYADQMQYIDMLGLNDAQIARRKNIPENGPWTRLIGHLKGDGANVLARHPDYIILGPAEGTSPDVRAKVYFIGDYEIGRSPIFQRDYEICIVPMVSGPKFTYYQRRDAGTPCPSQL